MSYHLASLPPWCPGMELAQASTGNKTRLAWLVVKTRPAAENPWASGPVLAQTGSVPGATPAPGFCSGGVDRARGRAWGRAHPLEARLNSSCSGTLDKSLSLSVLITIIFSKHFHLRWFRLLLHPEIFKGGLGGLERDSGSPKAPSFSEAGPDLEPEVLPQAFLLTPPFPPHPICTGT